MVGLLETCDATFAGHGQVLQITNSRPPPKKNLGNNDKLCNDLQSPTTFTQSTPEDTEFGEITQNNGHYAIQGHSRSPILVPIESSYTTSY